MTLSILSCVYWPFWGSVYSGMGTWKEVEEGKGGGINGVEEDLTWV